VKIEPLPITFESEMKKRSSVLAFFFFFFPLSSLPRRWKKESLFTLLVLLAA